MGLMLGVDGLICESVAISLTVIKNTSQDCMSNKCMEAFCCLIPSPQTASLAQQKMVQGVPSISHQGILQESSSTTPFNIEDANMIEIINNIKEKKFITQI